MKGWSDTFRNFMTEYDAIKKGRKKVAIDPSIPKRIKNIYGIGYLKIEINKV